MNRLALALGVTPLIGSSLALAQNGTMMNGGTAGGWMGGWMGGYGGAWLPILLVVVVALVAWIALRKRK